MFIHRKLKNGDICFLANQNNFEDKIEANFRISRYRPWLWDLATVTINPATYYLDGELTAVSIPMDSFGYMFVVFSGRNR